MVKINSINSVNNYQYSNKQVFKGNETVQTNPQIEQLSNIQPDFAVKTPMAYTKTGEMNFPYDTKAYCYKLANGQRVIVVPQEGETVLRTYVNTGSMNEPDNLRGISHYIEHNLFNGSQGLEQGDFFKQVDKMGGSTNASTSFAETNYYISSNLLNDGDLENKIKLHASMLETPIFAAEKLEKEKGIVNSEINMITQNPENLAVNRMLKNLYNIKTTSTDMIGGTTDNITNLSREDVVNYYNNNYYPANMVTVITGDVNPEETIKLISKYFTSKKQPAGQRHFESLTPTQKTIREDLISDKATATSIVLGFNGPASNNTKERIYLEALDILLVNSTTARISTRLKEFGTGCEMDTEKLSTNPSEPRAVIFVSSSTENNSEKVLKQIFNEIGNIENNPPSDEEMLIIKKKMLNSFPTIFESSFGTNNAIGTSFLENNQDYLNNYEQIVKSMTAQDLVNTAKKYLDINKASVTLVHPATATAESIKQNYKNTISFTGAKKEPVNIDSVKQYNLSNNYRVVLSNSKTDNAKIAFQIYTDKYFNNNKPSTALVLEQLLREEASMLKDHDEFASYLGKNGIIKKTACDENSLSYTLSCNVEDMQAAADAIKETLEHPRLTEQEFVVAKYLLKEKLMRTEKSAFDKLATELYKNLPVGYTKEEILKDLDTLKFDDVKELYSYLLNNGKGEIVISAPFDKNQELTKLVFNNFSTLPTVKPYSQKVLEDIYTPVEKTKVLTEKGFTNQAEIIQAYKFRINENIKDLVTIALLDTILGGNPSSRLFNDLREQKKLAYQVKSSFETSNNQGILLLRIKTTTDNKDTGEKSFDNIQKSIEGFNKHIEKIKTEKVTEEELNNAKLNLKNTVLNNNNFAYGKMSGFLLGIKSPYGISRDNQIFEEIDKITADDIYNAANYIFSGKPVYSIYTTQETLDANKNYLQSLSDN